MKDEVIKQLLQWASNIGELIEGQTPLILKEFALIGLSDVLIFSTIILICTWGCIVFTKPFRTKHVHMIDAEVNARMLLTIGLLFCCAISLSFLRDGLHQFLSPRTTFIKMLLKK